MKSGLLLAAALAAAPLAALADPATSPAPSPAAQSAGAPSPAAQSPAVRSSALQSAGPGSFHALATAAAPPPPPPIPPVVLAWYPAAARAAGVEGVATLSCARDEHLTLQACQLISESPAGQGFGAAAVAMAAKSQSNPKINITDPKQRAPITFPVHFMLHPPDISPDLTQMGHVVTQPALVAVPTRAEIQAAYPVRALDDGVDGVAVIECLVSKIGKLGECQLYGENPTGYGFGAAALDLAGDFALKPRLIDGDPVDGAAVRVPVQFQAHDPEAPLTLETKPAQ